MLPQFDTSNFFLMVTSMWSMFLILYIITSQYLFPQINEELLGEEKIIKTEENTNRNILIEIKLCETKIKEKQVSINTSLQEKNLQLQEEEKMYMEKVKNILNEKNTLHILEIKEKFKKIYEKQNLHQILTQYLNNKGNI